MYIPKVPKAAKSSAVNRVDLQAKLGAAIKADRQILGVTQEELAFRAGMHRTYLASIERGKRNITLRSVANLARALDVSVRSLLNQSDLSDAGPRDRPRGGEILMIEDNPYDAELTMLAFEKAKFTNPFRLIARGREALMYINCLGKYSKRQPIAPQVILLDLNLPDISGQEVLRELKANEATSSIPVFVLTISNEDEHAKECSELGATGYIVKPVNFENFRQSVAKLDFHWTLEK